MSFKSRKPKEKKFETEEAEKVPKENEIDVDGVSKEPSKKQKGPKAPSTRGTSLLHDITTGGII